jgi:hypothetical protein
MVSLTPRAENNRSVLNAAISQSRAEEWNRGRVAVRTGWTMADSVHRVGVVASAVFPEKFVIKCTGCETLMQAPKACKQLTCYQPACKRLVTAVDYPDLRNKIATWRRKEEAKRQKQAQQALAPEAGAQGR